MDAFILAGGASRRMGTDKSQLLIDRQTFTERISETLLTLTDSVTIVGRQEESSNLPSVADVYPQWGALGERLAFNQQLRLVSSHSSGGAAGEDKGFHIGTGLSCKS